jgi:hypothetical protein
LPAPRRIPLSLISAELLSSTATSLLILNNTTTAVHTFTGTLASSISLYQNGSDTLELGAQNNTAVSLRINSGRLRFLGDQRIRILDVRKNDPGTQTADLNGHSVRLFDDSIALGGLHGRFPSLIGNSSDGIYDSTATARDAVGIQYPSPGGGLFIKLTRKGDAYLDSIVNFTDLVTVAQHYGLTGGGNAGVNWDTGDFDYNGTVGFSDLVAIAQNYGGTFPAAPIAGASPDFNADLAAAFASVPEPSLLAWIAIATAPLLKRRRRAN